MAVQRVLVLGDEKKGGSREVVTAFAGWLGKQVADVRVILDRSAPLHAERADLVIVFGGDGSILGAARRMGPNQIPTVGINLGRVGFLTACGPEHAQTVAERAIAGELSEEPRLMLQAFVQRADGSRTDTVTALNDAVISRDSEAGFAHLRACRANLELARYVGDGLIIATPTGSTAYSLAAGGPVLSPEMDAVVLTPLASHSLALRPLVVPLHQGLDLLVEEAGGADSCGLVMDGQVAMRAGVGDRICLRPGAVRFRHLMLREDSFYRVFREKFGWGDQPRG